MGPELLNTDIVFATLRVLRAGLHAITGVVIKEHTDALVGATQGVAFAPSAVAIRQGQLTVEPVAAVQCALTSVPYDGPATG